MSEKAPEPPSSSNGEAPGDLRKFAWAVIATGALTLLIAIVLVLAGSSAAPQTPPTDSQNPGFRTALVWLELARSREDVFAILGDPAQPVGGTAAEQQPKRDAICLRSQLDTVNRIDFLFLLSYPAFTLALAVYFFRLGVARGAPIASAKWFAIASACLCCLMAVSDIAENVQLFALTRAQSPEEIEQRTLDLLRLWTTAKWFALFLAALLQGLAWAGLHARRNPLLALLGLVNLSGFALAIAALASLLLGPEAFRSDLRPLIELATVFLFVGWVIGLAHAALWLRRNPRGSGGAELRSESA